MNAQLHLAEISAICCIGMVGADAFGTVLTRAIATGRARLAGVADVGSDFFGKCLLTGYGLATLTHGHGAAGWLWCLPVFATGYVTTRRVTEATNRLAKDSTDG